jgi:hypothetical protein
MAFQYRPVLSWFLVSIFLYKHPFLSVICQHRRFSCPLVVRLSFHKLAHNVLVLGFRAAAEGGLLKNHSGKKYFLFYYSTISCFLTA